VYAPTATKTPPFVPEVQPIELIWAYVKTLVAQQLHASPHR